jgi:HAD superfamily hydrolase (TIGR01549 family)
MIEALIFDVDGTLVDSVDLHAKAWQEAFRKFGLQVGFKEVRFQIGKGSDQLLPVFFSPQELRRLGKELEAYRSHLFKEKYLPEVRAFPKVRELFERVLADGKRLALASSAPEEELKVYKSLAQIDDLIEEETSKDDVHQSKPHPDIFQAALADLGGIPVERALVIGDSPHDAEAAAKIGLRTIGLLCGGFPESVLREAGCATLYHDPADLLARYEESPIKTVI